MIACICTYQSIDGLLFCRTQLYSDDCSGHMQHQKAGLQPLARHKNQHFPSSSHGQAAMNKLKPLTTCT